jgi:hypothetical protein
MIYLAVVTFRACALFGANAHSILQSIGDELIPTHPTEEIGDIVDEVPDETTDDGVDEVLYLYCCKKK